MEFLERLLLVGITAIGGLISSILTYHLGKRAKIDEEKIKRRFQIAEEVAVLLEYVIETDNYFYDFYRQNYGHVGRIETAIENFEQMRRLFQDEHARISQLMSKRDELRKRMLLSKLYLSGKFIRKSIEYLDLSAFHYIHNGGMSVNTFHTEFFRNIVDERIHKKRVKLQKFLLKKLSHLL